MISSHKFKAGSFLAAHAVVAGQLQQGIQARWLPRQVQLQQMAARYYSTGDAGQTAGGPKPLRSLKSLKGLKGAGARLPFQEGKVYDVIVVGGGTGGISAAQEARELGLSVALFDYVSPSNQGSTWGLGGTCVNVGCIPKKLFHIGAQVEETSHMLKDYGWKVEPQKHEHDWATLRGNIQDHIKAVNFGYRGKMQEIGVDYVNAYAQFEDDKHIKFTHGADGKEYRLSAKNFLIAAGNRPRDYPGMEELAKYAITSDDLFSLKEDPGSTLVIGGGYIAVECAGFLNGLGKEVTMVNRSTFLRVMDDDMTFRIVDDMRAHGVQALERTVPVGVQKLGDKLYEVELQTGEKRHKLQVNTILVAVGRDAQPEKLALQNAGVVLAPSKKVKGRDDEPERTNVDHIYAVGDVLEGAPELMPVAQKAGKLVAHRIHARMLGEKSEDEIKKQLSTDYRCIPTTVFSPAEYSYVGLNEQEAIQEYGEDNIEVYHREVTPLQFSIVKGNQRTAYMKLICLRAGPQKVLGLHYLGPGADEVVAGYGVAMKLGMTKEHLDGSIGIHPSVSEDYFNMHITKRSGAAYAKTDC